jgi:glycosyltransferase involved in cell wall biosynthesis
LDAGGVENTVVRLVTGLDPARFKSSVCSIKEGGRAASELSAQGFKISALGAMSGHGFDFGAVSGIRRLIRETGVHVVVTNQYHAGLYGRLAAALSGGCAAVAVFHSSYRSPGKPKLHRRMINNLLARRTDAIVAVSQSVASDIAVYDRINAGKVHVIHNGIPLERFSCGVFKDDARKRFGLPAGRTIIGTLGRITREKNHLGLVEAAAKIEGAHVAIAGDGPLRGDVESLAGRLGVPLTVTGWLDADGAAEFLNAPDVFCFPSLWEGFALAPIEALAAGLPIVASDIAPNREALGDAAVFVPVGDIAALSESLAMLCGDDGLRARLSGAALLRAPVFSIKNTVRAYENLLDEAVRKRANNGG